MDLKTSKKVTTIISIIAALFSNSSNDYGTWGIGYLVLFGNNIDSYILCYKFEI